MESLALETRMEKEWKEAGEKEEQVSVISESDKVRSLVTEHT